MDRFRLDAHVKVLDETVAERAKARGLDGLVYAPHFTRLPDIRERAAEFTDDDLLVVPGREVFTGDWRNRKHVLAVGLEAPVPDFITLEAAMAEFDRQDAAVLAPHPEFATVSLEAHDIRAHRDRIHAVEVYNPKHFATHNERARELAAEFELPAFGSSYAHLPGTVGEVWTGFDRRFETADELVAALREGVPRGVYHRDGPRHRLRCMAEFGHLFYENSWGKIDRLFLSGTEPTHPDHIAYDGRFDDVSVY
ncbi:PHP domain protein [Natronomonas pharaonis DSM 2160]|uniref:PHP domain protein n=1 Tax=Natronomonas pharaonis (strain ATCC 35678 / DSM 2160 / CIP 103997 / JCM 8858 / NBRC 14720 / NCIMB 2260 / Gabara) TaxID=348780 RepID=A0A1U7EU67_NATPD|nr:PHP-associated domain-containing protein [Natronomonas pharaonis]CAI48500.1 PHP domain protein [Natronomonas pharaonis DSM 2160]